MMVDPFQTLDNAAGSTGSCENSDNILVLQLINMSEDTTNLEKSNNITSVQQILNAETTKTQTEEEKTSADVACVNQEQGSLPKDDDDEKMIMGGPSTSETELIVLPSCSSECDTINSAETNNDEDINGQKKHLANSNNFHEKKELSEPDSSTVKTNTKVLKAEDYVLLCESNALVDENCDNQQKLCKDSIQSGVSSSSAVVFNNNYSVKGKLSTPPPPSVISSDDQIDNSSSHKLGQVESLLKMEENHNNNSNSSPTSTTEVVNVDNRKVEPLKINLNRDPIILKLPKPPQDVPPEIIPKITIKPIQKPVEDMTTTTATTTSGNPMTNNISTNLEAPPEPHIVPKLTIRNSTNSSGLGSQSVIVPKLTIKMDNHVTTVSQNTTSKDKSVILEDGVKLTIKSVPEIPPPIPKLTIKTSSTTGGCTLEEKSDCLNNVKYSINARPSSPLMTRANAKANAKQTENVVPKLKIKLNSDDRSDTTSNSQALNVNCTEIKTVPKLVVRVPPKDQLDVDDTPVEGSTSDDEDIKMETEPSELETIPKITIRQVKKPEHTSEETIVIPKVTIKPIVNPNNEQEDLETLVTPKITLKPIPKPLDITQPLEVVTSCTSTFKAKLESVDSQQQQSPRIVIKINKNVSETITKNEPQPEKEKETIVVHDAVPVDKKQTQDAQVSSSLSLLERCLKRPASTSIMANVESKKQKIETEPTQKPRAEVDGNMVEKVQPITIDLLSEDNEDENENCNVHEEEPTNLNVTPEPTTVLTLTTTTTTSTTSPIESIDICDEEPQQQQESNKNVQLNTALFPLYCDEKISSPPIVHSLDENDPTEEHQPLDNILFNHHHYHRDNTSPSLMNNDSLLSQHSTDDSQLQKCSEIIVVSEESSSDCIMVEDNGAMSFAPTAFNIKLFNKNGHNIEQPTDLPNSVQSTPSPPQQLDKSCSRGSVKRGRGRPRKARVPYT